MPLIKLHLVYSFSAYSFYRCVYMQNTRAGYLKNLNARELDFQSGKVYDVRITFSLEIEK